jgi:hypothetical protein
MSWRNAHTISIRLFDESKKIENRQNECGLIRNGGASLYHQQAGRTDLIRPA